MCRAARRGGSCQRAAAVCPGPIMPGPCCRVHIYGVIGKHVKRRDAFPEYGGSDSSCRSGPRKTQRRKFPEARVACGYELSDARAGYRAVLYISGISSTWSRESLAKARQTTTSSHRSHVP